MKLKISKSKGLTLVEVLVALALFAIGMLGMALFTGNAIKVTSDDNVRAIALYTTANELEKVFVAGGHTAEAFSAALEDFDTDDDVNTYSTTVYGNSGRDSFTVEILAARASNGVNVLLNNNPSTWTPPINMAVEVRYDEDPSISVRTTYTFVYYHES